MNKDVLQDFQKETDFGEIELDIGNDLFNFQWVEFAPPSGVMATNYLRHFHSAFFYCFFNFTHYCIDMSTENRVNHINISSHGQSHKLWPIIKEGTSTTVTMEFTSKEVMTWILYISMEQAYKMIHPLHKLFPSSTRLA